MHLFVMESVSRTATAATLPIFSWRTSFFTMTYISTFAAANYLFLEFSAANYLFLESFNFPIMKPTGFTCCSVTGTAVRSFLKFTSKICVTWLLALWTESNWDVPSNFFEIILSSYMCLGIQALSFTTGALVTLWTLAVSDYYNFLVSRLFYFWTDIKVLSTASSLFFASASSSIWICLCYQKIILLIWF